MVCYIYDTFVVLVIIYYLDFEMDLLIITFHFWKIETKILFNPWPQLISFGQLK